jgi:hypothetical protein
VIWHYSIRFCVAYSSVFLVLVDIRAQQSQVIACCVLLTNMIGRSYEVGHGEGGDVEVPL